jgi:hypothetical protein
LFGNLSTKQSYAPYNETKTRCRSRNSTHTNKQTSPPLSFRQLIKDNSQRNFDWEIHRKSSFFYDHNFTPLQKKPMISLNIKKKQKIVSQRPIKK